MIEYEIKTFEEEVPNKITCDVCGNDIETIVDSQEALYINFVGGYGSLFGDGARVRAEICQKCLKDVLGNYLRIE